MTRPPIAIRIRPRSESTSGSRLRPRSGSRTGWMCASARDQRRGSYDWRDAERRSRAFQVGCRRSGPRRSASLASRYKRAAEAPTSADRRPSSGRVAVERDRWCAAGGVDPVRRRPPQLRRGLRRPRVSRQHLSRGWAAPAPRRDSGDADRRLRTGRDRHQGPRAREAAALERAWIEAAQAEYASVWAFVRMAGELIALGAPDALVGAACEAADDELRHADACLQLSGARFLLRPLSPQAASPRWQSQSSNAVAQIAREAWVDGCLAEGIAATQAGDAAAHASREPHTAAAHAAIARDERRHAELAWRVLGLGVAGGRRACARRGHGRRRRAGRRSVPGHRCRARPGLARGVRVAGASRGTPTQPKPKLHVRLAVSGEWRVREAWQSSFSADAEVSKNEKELTCVPGDSSSLRHWCCAAPGAPPRKMRSLLRADTAWEPISDGLRVGDSGRRLSVRAVSLAAPRGRRWLGTDRRPVFGDAEDRPRAAKPAPSRRASALRLPSVGSKRRRGTVPIPASSHGSTSMCRDSSVDCSRASRSRRRWG